jgi:hypothetical protein
MLAETPVKVGHTRCLRRQTPNPRKRKIRHESSSKIALHEIWFVRDRRRETIPRRSGSKDMLDETPFKDDHTRCYTDTHQTQENEKNRHQSSSKIALHEICHVEDRRRETIPRRSGLKDMLVETPVH